MLVVQVQVQSYPMVNFGDREEILRLLFQNVTPFGRSSEGGDIGKREDDMSFLDNKTRNDNNNESR